MTKWIWSIVGLIGVGAAVLLLLVVPSHQPQEKFGEDGTFANDCCGTIKLTNGKMLLNDTQSVRYTVRKDAKGPYILPEVFVGIMRYQGFEVDGTRSTMKLRLDRLPQPTGIELYEGVGSTPYIFAKRPAAVQERHPALK
jgi:hypothetical protein